MTRSRSPLLAFWLMAAVTAACNNNTPSSPNYDGSGGRGTGGSSSGGSGSGGSFGSGGSAGNAGTSGTGGVAGSGGSASGGSSGGSGGSTGSGGSSASGGSRAFGGSSDTGVGMGGSGGGNGGSASSSGGNGGSADGSTSSGGTSAAGGSSGPRDAGPEVARGPEAGTGDSTSTVSYASQIAPLLKANCTSCHGGANPRAGINLSTYASVRSNANAANSAIQNGIMPPTGALSAANKQLFQSWVNAGAPNN
jgi:hypothetical protein